MSTLDSTALQARNEARGEFDGEVDVLFHLLQHQLGFADGCVYQADEVGQTSFLLLLGA